MMSGSACPHRTTAACSALLCWHYGNGQSRSRTSAFIRERDVRYGEHTRFAQLHHSMQEGHVNNSVQALGTCQCHIPASMQQQQQQKRLTSTAAAADILKRYQMSACQSQTEQQNKPSCENKLQVGEIQNRSKLNMQCAAHGYINSFDKWQLPNTSSTIIML
jgi:hypothetical protein